MLNKIIMTLAALAFAGVAQAEEEGFKISGDFAAAYTVDDTSDHNNGALGRHNQVALDLAEINVEKMMGNSHLHIGVGYGSIIQQTNGVAGAGTVDPLTGTPKSTLNLTNAYLKHTFETGTSFRVGRMGSFLGYESYNYMNNNNYNRSRGFDSLAPWWLTGLEVNHNFADMFDVSLYAVNAAARTDGDENKSMSYGVSATLTAVENFTAKVNYYTGKEGVGATAHELTIMELQVKYDMDAFSFGADYISNSQDPDAAGGTKSDANSIALYAAWNQETYGAALRYEMVDDSDGQISVADNDFSTITLSGHYDVDTNARMIAEVMMDSSDKKIWADNDGVAANEDSLMRINLGLMYRF